MIVDTMLGPHIPQLPSTLEVMGSLSVVPYMGPPAQKWAKENLKWARAFTGP